MSLSRILAAAASLALLGAIGRTHAVAPTLLTMSPGASDFIYVVDGGGCPATITASSTNPGIEVYALDMSTGNQLSGGGSSATVPNRVDQVFRIFVPASTAPTTGTIEVCWIGSTWPNAPCSENNCLPSAPAVVNVVVRDASLGAGNRLSSGVVGDPIETSDGELFLAEPADLDLGGPLPLGFQRYYGGHLEANGVGPGALGPNWRHSFEWSWASAGNALLFTTPTGREIRFETDFFAPGAWTQVGGGDVPFALRESGPDYLLADLLTGRMYTFDPAGRLTRVEDCNGNALTLSYAFADLAQVTDGRGRTLTFTHGGAGEMTGVSDGARTVSFTYTGGGSLATVTDAGGEVTTYAYDPTSPTWLASVTRPEGNVRHTQTYTPAGRVASQTASGGHTTTLAYDPVAGTTTVTDPLGNTQVHAHTADGRMTAHTGEGGAPAPVQYDASGRRTAVSDRRGNTTSWTWHASGRVARMTEADGSATTLGYTARQKNGFTFHDLTSLTRADGRSETFAYDAAGNLVQHVDPAGNTWSWTYDAMGNVLTATNPKGGVTTLAWNADGTLASATDDAGNATTFAYDGLKRPVQVTLPDTSTLAYAYDAMDRVVSMTDETGAVSSFTYDRNGNLTSVAGPATGAWSFGYDTLDRLEAVTDPLGRSMTATFDELGRVQTVTDARNETTTYAYDAAGNLTAVTDPDNETWARGYDADGLLVSRTDPLARTSTFTPDELGRYTAIATPLGNVTTFDHDALGRLTRVRTPALNATAFGYDARGLVASIALPGGATSALARDALGLVTQVTDPLGNAWTFAYDDQGRRTSQTDPLGNQSAFQHDARGRVDRVDFPGGLGSVDVTYDAAGRATRLAYSDGTTLDFTYDAGGRPTGGTDVTLAYDAAGRMSSSNGLAIGRGAAGLITSVTYAAGRTVNYSYDAAGRLMVVLDWAGGITLFVYDDAGQLTDVLRPNQANTVYTYDADGRVTRVLDADPFDHTKADHMLTRDVEGNVVGAVRLLPVEGRPALGAVAHTYDAAGQVAGFTYDALGRLTNDGVRAYAWNLASHLTSYTEAGQTVFYTYDVFGNVRSRTAQGATERFVWNYALGLPSVAVVRQVGTDRTYYVHTPGGALLYSIDAATNARLHYHYDEAGNTVALTDDQGNVTDAWHHTPSGVELARLGTTRTPFTFGGRMGVMQESDTGLYRMRARLYDAPTARFVSRDPVEAGDPRGVNPYQYAYGNPLRWVDPRGTTPEPADGPLQIEIESHFVTVKDNFLQDVGVDFRGLGAPGGLQPANRAADPSPVAIPGTGFLSSYIDDLTVELILRAVQKGERSQTLSAPLVLIANPSPISPSEVPFLLTGAAGGQVPTAGSRDGVKLEVRPVISADRRYVTLDVTPTVSTVTAAIGGFAPANYAGVIRKLRNRYLPYVRYYPPWMLPELHLRGVSTSVSVPDGGTLLLGGLISEQTSRQSEVPVLGNIPLLGRLFRGESDVSRPSFLYIYVTSRIVGPNERFQ